MNFAEQRIWGPKPRYPMVLNYEPDKKEFMVIAGPCSVESSEQIHKIAKFVKMGGATHLRGGLFRAGTYPSQNFGLISDDFIWAYDDAAHDNELKAVIEVLSYDEEDFSRVNKFADVIQVGARSMQNYQLLRKVGLEAGSRQVFIKRHPGCTLDEWLGAAEHVLQGAKGSTSRPQICLIERGSVSHVNHVRWDLSVSMIPAVHALNPHLPVIIDASHGTGRRDLVGPMTLAGVAAGADGVLLEVHEEPDKSLSDPEQAITPERFFKLTKQIWAVRRALEGTCVKYGT